MVLAAKNAKSAKASVVRAPGVARAPSPLQGVGAGVARALDVARAPTPLQGVEVQGRGGLATSGSDATSAMPNIVQTWKSVSSHRINKLLGRKGALWQSDYYNHIIRTPGEYANQLGYVLRNNMVLARQFDVDVARATDVARAPTPLQGVEVQGRGGLATSGGDATPAPQGRGGLATSGGDATPAPQGRGGLATSGPATSAVQGRGGLATSAGFFPGKDRRYWSDIDVYQGEALPRWSMGRAIYHICFRLADSVPQAKLREWEAAREEFRLKRRNGEVLSEDELRKLKNLYSENIERYLDSGYGECLLRESGVADLVVQTLLHDNGKSYVIHAVGIMPNHVHVIAEFDVARAPTPLPQGRGGLATSGGDATPAPQGRGGLATSDVARAPTPLQCVEVQDRGGLATSGGDVARAPTPLQSHFIFDTINKP